MNEALGRFLFALAVAVGVASGQDAVALGIVAAPLLSLIVVPLAFVGPLAPRRRRAAPAPARDAGGRGVHARERRRFRGGRVLGHALRADAPERRAAARPARRPGAAAAGYIFNVLLVARAPLLLFQGIATSLLPHLTRLRSRGTEGAEAFRLSIRGTMTAIAAFTAAVCGGDAGRRAGPRCSSPSATSSATTAWGSCA